MGKFLVSLVGVMGRATICTRVLVMLGVGLCFSGNVAVAGNLFVAASGSIYEFNSSGIRSTFATGGLTESTELAFDSSGNLFDADMWTKRIYKFTPGGSGSIFATNSLGVTALAFDRSGTLFVSDMGAHIYKIAPDGGTSTFATGYVAESFAFDSSGNLFADTWNSSWGPSYSIDQFTSTGTRSTFSTDVYRPEGLAFDSSGNLFEADLESGKIYEFAPDKTRSTFATGLKSPSGLAFDSSGDLFVADSGSGNIYRFTPDGIRYTFASGLSNPTALAFSPTPEPSAIVLFCIGAASLLAYAWRRRAAA